MFKHHLCLLFPIAALAASSASAYQPSGANASGWTGFREDLQQGIVLTATSNAPARASGKAQIIAVDDNGTNLAVLFVKTTGLTNGAYTVKATAVGGSNTYSLGSLNVAASAEGCGDGFRGGGERGRGFERERYSIQTTNSNPWTNWVDRCGATNAWLTNFLCGRESTNEFGTNVFKWYTNCLTAGSGSFVLPSGLAQSNVAGIFVSDANGVVDLTGDFTGVTNSTSVYIETVSLVPGTATNAQGQATLTITSKNGKSFGEFMLSATGLRTGEKLWLTANGTNTVKECASKAGTLKVTSLPRVNLVLLKTVVATDVSSNVVFSVGF